MNEQPITNAEIAECLQEYIDKCDPNDRRAVLLRRAQEIVLAHE